MVSVIPEPLIDLELFTTCIYIVKCRKYLDLYVTLPKLTVKQSFTVYQSILVKTWKPTKSDFESHLKIPHPVVITSVPLAKTWKNLGPALKEAWFYWYFFTPSVLYKRCTSLHFCIHVYEVAARTFIIKSLLEERASYSILKTKEVSQT